MLDRLFFTPCRVQQVREMVFDGALEMSIADAPANDDGGVPVREGEVQPTQGGLAIANPTIAMTAAVGSGSSIAAPRASSSDARAACASPRSSPTRPINLFLQPETDRGETT
jgi:hypothetical protein